MFTTPVYVLFLGGARFYNGRIPYKIALRYIISLEDMKFDVACSIQHKLHKVLYNIYFMQQLLNFQ